MSFLDQLARLAPPHLWVLLSLTLLAFAFFLGSWLAVHALFPRYSRICQEVIARPLHCLVAGSLAAIPGAGFCWLFDIWRWHTGALIVATLVVGAGLVGLVGLARRIGNGMISSIDKEQPWRRTFRGGVVLGSLFCFPLLGWLLAAGALVMGMGCAALSLLKQSGENSAKDEES